VDKTNKKMVCFVNALFSRLKNNQLEKQSTEQQSTEQLGRLLDIEKWRSPTPAEKPSSTYSP